MAYSTGICVRLAVLNGLFLASVLAFGQETGKEAYINTMKLGMEFQGKREFESAISKYREAALHQPKPSTAHLQMAYCFMMLGKPDSLLKYSSLVISYHDANEPTAIVMKSFALAGAPASLGNADELITGGVTRFPENASLWQQYGIIKSRMGDAGKAEKGFLTSLKFQKGIPDLHYEYGKSQGMQFTAFFPLYYFLLLEANTPRAEDAFNTMVNLLKFLLWASAGETPPADRMELYQQGTSWFFTDLIPSAMQEHEAMPEREPWVETWFEFYIKFFSALDKAGHREAFVYMSAQTSKEPLAVQWVQDHPARVDLFMAWLKASGR